VVTDEYANIKIGKDQIKTTYNDVIEKYLKNFSNDLNI